MTGTHRMEVDLPGRKLRWEAELVFRSDLTGYRLRVRAARVRERQAAAREALDAALPARPLTPEPAAAKA